MLNFGNKEFRNLQEQVLENAKNIEILKAKPQMRVAVVDELPAVGDPTVIYLVPSEEGESPNLYEEYVWLEDEERYEMIGTTGIDVQNLPSPIYVTTAEKPEGLSYGLRIRNNGWTSDLQQEGGAKLELTGTAVNITGDLTTSGKIQVGASGYNIKKDGSNMVLEADGNPVKIRGTLLPNANNTYSLGSSSIRWYDAYINNQLNFDTGLYIAKDASNRIGLYYNNVERIKLGHENSSYFAINISPDANASYSLGTSTLQWKDLYLSGQIQSTGSLGIFGYVGTNTTGFTIGNGIIQANRNLTATANETRDLGSSSIRWLTTYTKNINDGTNEIAVSDIATKPDYANPDVFASGTLDANGEGTIDISAQGVGMPEDGLYMFTYGNAQCFIALTSTMIQNATQYPMRCPCPLLFNGSGYPGNLRIDRSADILTLKVAAPNVGVATPSGMGWQLIKVL